MTQTRRAQKAHGDSHAPVPRLLDPRALEHSETVANACMNRERNLAGSNSYVKELGLDPLDFLSRRLQVQDEVSWLDLCCGTGRALLQAAKSPLFASSGRHAFMGVDLVPMFESDARETDGVRLIPSSIERWTTDKRFDLITCVHGLHYVGDKLGVLERAAGWLKESGRLMMHIDYRNLRIAGRGHAWVSIGKSLSRAGFRFIPNRRLLVREGPADQGLLAYRYLGADDRAGANFTGQAAVDSYYERVPPSRTVKRPLRPPR